ncbi:MAG: DNA primase, partial [Candidatus Symbiothrix sp.]|nr:DNA primase [Candidatus Symbiothrix sp.]
MYISPSDKEKILHASEGRMLEIIGQFTALKHVGVSYEGECPVCGDKNGLVVTPGKSIFKCFKCNGLKGKRAIDYLQKGQKMGFVDALKYLADHLGVYIETQTPPPAPVAKTKKTGKAGKEKNTFCARMLAASGLTYEDTKTKIFSSSENRTITESITFKPGTIDERGNIVPGDDAIIEYYDLDGNPVTYNLYDKRGNVIKTCEYFRVRWQFPEEHTDKEGKPMKYRSPWKAGSHIYIPQKMRELYRSRTKIPVLFIQEGEKKAEKACKHGLPSVAVSGIQNIAEAGKLPEDLIRIITDCKASSVVFLLDSDWNNIHGNIKITDNVARRPNTFFNAVRNYKDYMRTLMNRNLYVEIYFGHVKKNTAGDKGVDDLLAGTLAGTEDELKRDIDHLINEKDLDGKYIKAYKITGLNDYQIKCIWHLENVHEFAKEHRDELQDLPEFKFYHSSWKFDENGNVTSAQPLEEYEKFWTESEVVDKNGLIHKKYEYEYLNALFFLQNRGFGRYLTKDNQINPDFIRIEGYTARLIQHWEARQFLFDFSMDNCPRDVSNMLVKGGTQYLGPDKMAFLSLLQPNFPDPNGNVQYFYFEKETWEVTRTGVRLYDTGNIRHHVWKDCVIRMSPRLLEPLFSFQKDEAGNYGYTLSKDGKNCHFLQFLINASNFSWKKEKLIAEGNKDVFISDEDRQENVRHLLSKLCAIGYMAMEFKDPNVIKAVVGMDGKQGTGSDSNGRCGKSLIGVAMEHVMPVAYINGKKKDIETDQFIWNDVAEKTRLVFMDDVSKGFNLESQFANLSGSWQVNYKGGGRRTFPFSTSPKMYISTNFTLRGNGDSFRARQWLLGFSDYYNARHQPKDDFGILFFNEWENDQWERFCNLIACCVHLYMNFGVMEAPEDRLMQRIDMNIMGERFIDWAEAYFENEDDLRINRRIPRRDME